MSPQALAFGQTQDEGRGAAHGPGRAWAGLLLTLLRHTPCTELSFSRVAAGCSEAELRHPDLAQGTGQILKANTHECFLSFKEKCMQIIQGLKSLS